MLGGSHSISASQEFPAYLPTCLGPTCLPRNLSPPCTHLAIWWVLFAYFALQTPAPGCIPYLPFPWVLPTFGDYIHSGDIGWSGWACFVLPFPWKVTPYYCLPIPYLGGRRRRNIIPGAISPEQGRGYPE